MIHVLIVDDERNIQKAYRADLSAASDRYTLVDSIANAEDAEVICKLQQVDLILMDINTAGNENGLMVARRIKAKMPEIKIIITTSYLDPYAMELAKQFGVDSFWLKDYSPVELLEVIEQTIRGENYWPEDIPDITLGATRLSALSPAERAVFYQLLRSVSLKETAKALFIQESTLKVHLKNICRKVQCKNKTELLILAIQNRLILPNLDHQKPGESEE